MSTPHRKVSTEKIRAAFDRLPAIDTQKDVAERAGLSPASITYYLHGTCKPSARTLPRLAAALNVTEEDLTDSEC